MRILKSVIRQPKLYLLLAAVVIACTVMMTVSYSVYLSCIAAEEEINSSFDLAIEIAVKEKNKPVLGENGLITVENTNKSLIDSKIIGAVYSVMGDVQIKACTNAFTFQSDWFMPEEVYDKIASSAKNGETFYYNRNNRIANEQHFPDIDIIGFDDESLLATKLGISVESLNVTYIQDSGLILPSSLYHGLGEPKKVVAGWFSNLGEGYGIYPTENGYRLREENKADILNKLDRSQDVHEVFDVRGYYDESPFCRAVMCSYEEWERLWSIFAAYNDISSSGTDSLGLYKLSASGGMCTEAENIIISLSEAGADMESYLISSNDYDAKFALYHIQSLRSFSIISFYAMIFFGCISVLLLTLNIIRLRQRDIFTLRSLGKSSFEATMDLTAELVITFSASIFLGYFTSRPAGALVIKAVESHTRAKAGSTIDTLSKVLEFMENNEQIRNTISSAIEKFNGLGFSFEFYNSPKLWAGAVALVVLITVMACIIYGIKASKNLLIDQRDAG